MSFSFIPYLLPYVGFIPSHTFEQTIKHTTGFRVTNKYPIRHLEHLSSNIVAVVSGHTIAIEFSDIRTLHEPVSFHTSKVYACAIVIINCARCDRVASGATKCDHDLPQTGRPSDIRKKHSHTLHARSNMRTIIVRQSAVWFRSNVFYCIELVRFVQYCILLLYYMYAPNGRMHHTVYIPNNYNIISRTRRFTIGTQTALSGDRHRSSAPNPSISPPVVSLSITSR